MLKQSLSIKSVTFRNRIGMSPMCTYSANNGFATDWHLVHYGTRAIGGAGLIIQEATAVTPEGRITPYDLGIWSDEQITGLRKITDFISAQNAIPAIQLAHAGRKASHDKPANGSNQLSPENGGWKTVAPSPIPYGENEIPPAELSVNEINTIVEQFKNGAKRALEAGYKVIEIHGAHGYLIHQFLSPLTNKRTDEYGGTFKNRIRFLLKIVDAIKVVWDEKLPIFIRLSATDWVENGWNLDDTVKLAEILRSSGVDLIDCSSGGNIISQKIELKPLYQVPFAEAIHKTGILTSAVGLITTKEQINFILENNKADMVLLGRELLRNPYFPLQCGINFPEQYLRSR